jgi:hypothetical protein
MDLIWPRLLHIPHNDSYLDQGYKIAYSRCVYSPCSTRTRWFLQTNTITIQTRCTLKAIITVLSFCHVPICSIWTELPSYTSADTETSSWTLQVIMTISSTRTVISSPTLSRRFRQTIVHTKHSLSTVCAFIFWLQFCPVVVRSGWAFFWLSCSLCAESTCKRSIMVEHFPCRESISKSLFMYCINLSTQTFGLGWGNWNPGNVSPTMLR